MSDETDIIALVHSYAYLLDAGDIDGVVALFAHATWHSDMNDVVRRGSTEVRPVYEQLMASGDGARTKHLLSNVTVTAPSETPEASSRCSWTVVQMDPTGRTRVTLTGQYLDRFVKVDGAWRFADRFIKTDPVA